MTAEQLVDAVRGGRRVYGTLVLSPSPLWWPAAKAAGADFVFIDTEHAPIDRAVVATMCRGFAVAGLPPIVRIPAPDPFLAAMAVDAGAAGVLVPYVETPEEVRELYGAVKLRPLKGQRLKRILAGEPIEPQLAAYLADYNRGRMLWINVESAPALAGLDAIFAVPGLDAAIVGPHDLSVSLGLPEQYADPRFERAVAEIIAKARARRLGVGIHHSVSLEQQIAWAKLGANIILHSSDLKLFADALRGDIARVRRQLGEPEAAGPRAGEIPAI